MRWCRLQTAWRPLDAFLFAAVVIGMFGGVCYVSAGGQQGGRVSEFRVGSRPVHYAGPLAFSPDGRTLALPKLADGTVELLSMETGEVEVLPPPFEKEEAHADEVVYSKDGRFLAVEYPRSSIDVWDLGARKQLAYCPTSPGNGVEDLAFTDDSQTLVVVYGGDPENANEQPRVFTWKSVRWEVPTGKRIGTVVFDPALYLRALSPDGRYAVFQYDRKPGGNPGAPHDEHGQDHYDVTTGQKLCTVDGGGAYTFSPDSTTLVAYL